MRYLRESGQKWPNGLPNLGQIVELGTSALAWDFPCARKGFAGPGRSRPHGPRPRIDDPALQPRRPGTPPLELHEVPPHAAGRRAAARVRIGRGAVLAMPRRAARGEALAAALGARARRRAPAVGHAPRGLI